jgi:hypothetical protein
MVVPHSATSLVEFVYVSRMSRNLPRAALARLERQCWANNMRARVTGELRLEANDFSQIIEGPWSDIMNLASRILTDPRHDSISIHSFRPIEVRRFSTWTSHGFETVLPHASSAWPGASNVSRLVVGSSVVPSAHPAIASASHAQRQR